MKVLVAQNSNKTQIWISAEGKWRMQCELLGIHEDQKILHAQPSQPSYAKEELCNPR